MQFIILSPKYECIVNKVQGKNITYYLIVFKYVLLLRINFIKWEKVGTGIYLLYPN